MVESASKLSLLRTEYAHERVLWPNSSMSSGYVHLYRVILILLVQDLGATLRELLLYHSAQAFVGNFVQPPFSGIRQSKKVTMACIIHTNTMPERSRNWYIRMISDVFQYNLQSAVIYSIGFIILWNFDKYRMQRSKIFKVYHLTLTPCHQSILPPLQSL